MLNNKQLKFLKKEAHHLKPIFQVGKGGVNQNMIDQISDALEARELIKVSVLQNALVYTKEAATALAEGTEAELVQVIGNTIVLYKESVNKKNIELPK